MTQIPEGSLRSLTKFGKFQILQPIILMVTTKPYLIKLHIIGQRTCSCTLHIPVSCEQVHP